MWLTLYFYQVVLLGTLLQGQLGNETVLSLIKVLSFLFRSPMEYFDNLNHLY